MYIFFPITEVFTMVLHHNIITIKNETIPYLEEKNVKKFENVTLISIEGFTIKMNSLLLMAMSNSLKSAFNQEDTSEYTIITEFDLEELKQVKKLTMTGTSNFMSQSILKTFFNKVEMDAILLQEYENIETKYEQPLEKIILSDNNIIGTKKFNNSIEKVKDLKIVENFDVKYENPIEEDNYYQDDNEYLSSTTVFDDEKYICNKTLKVEDVKEEKLEENLQNFQEKHITSSVTCPECQIEVHQSAWSRHLSLVHENKKKTENKNKFKYILPKPNSIDMPKNSSAILELTKIDNVFNELKNTTTVNISCKEEETENNSIEYSDDAPELAEKKQQKCEICGKSFTTLKAIGKHKLRMHGVKKPREKQGPYKIAERKDPNRLVPCEICGRSFRWRYLKNHKEVVHEKIKKKYSEQNDPNRLVQCEICGKSLKRKCLKNHKEVVHEKIKKNERKRSGICDQCGKFVNNLYCHKLYLHHTEDNPLTCKTCGKTVNNKHVLQKHEKACVKIPCKYINKILFRNKRLAFLKRFAETFHLIQTSYI